MSVLNNSLLLGQEGGAGYIVQRSLRFSSIDSAYCSRVPSTAGNRKTWTWAGWVKRSAITSSASYLYGLFSAESSGSDYAYIDFYQDGLRVTLRPPSGTQAVLQTTQVFRDPSAWYHIVVAQDTTQATASNRIKCYVNGSQITSFSTSTYPDLDAQGAVNQAIAHNVGRDLANVLYSTNQGALDGYLADVHFIDGQALDPSAFVAVSATTGQLIPKAYSGSFGTNGFWLKFSDNSAATATTLGKDYSGNNNNWSCNNLSVTAGAGNDSLTDTPTSYGTDTGAGGEVRGNYCTWNPLPTTTAKTFSDGNLQVVGSGADGYSRLYGTFGMSSGKWYFEVVPTAISGYVVIGISASEGNAYSSNAYTYLSSTGAKSNRGAALYNQSYGSSFTANDVIGVAVDLDSGKIWFAKNGTWQASGNPAAGTNAAYTDVLTYLKGAYVPYVTTDEFNSYTVVLNAGQRPFAYTAPSGFRPLVDTFLTTPVAKSSDYFQTVLYTGNGSTQTISGLGFSPDLVWLKCRSAANTHALVDSVRGVTKYLVSAATDAEVTDSGGITSLNSDGFSLTFPTSTAPTINANNATYVGWCFDAGSNTVSNTAGSITSQVRANPSAGFSIVTYTGPGPSNNTVGHGLGVAPELIITKNRDRSIYWIVYTKATGKDAFLRLNTTDASATSSNIWGTAAPTSTVFGGVGTDLSNGYTAGEKIVSYCFAPVAGYTSMGSYVGNGSSDGVFVHTGFRVRWLMVKATSVGSWRIYDTSRSPYNVSTESLYANLSDSETTIYTGEYADLLSNGFKMRGNGSASNNNGTTYIYFAVAESPFQYARAR